MFWRIFKKLDFKQLFGLFWMFLKNPMVAFPTVLATKKCMNIAYKEYGSKHHLSNKANAFRHALWVVLIIQKSLKWRKNEEKIKAWALKFTSWHEDFSPNKPLERAMDLHNNKVGITFFDEVKGENEAASITFLKEKASEAKQIKAVEETNNHKKSLVFITE
ncbi:hypothetical protein [Aequorivita sp. Q41]|uniref:DUF6973 domain-containing protein n=1 Tax=Aequorivita sp. Q41 TaxID=3153300 RepID=UPI003242BF78